MIVPTTMSSTIWPATNDENLRVVVLKFTTTSGARDGDR